MAALSSSFERTDKRICQALIYIVLVLSIGLFPNAGCTKTILEYPSLASAASLLYSSELHRAPVSAFHSWEEAEREAQRIIIDWQTEPLSLVWTRIQLDRYVKHKTMPTRGARGLALVHVAMHDAFDIATRRGADTKLAVSMAAAQVLGYLFAAEERSFDRIVYALAAANFNAPRDNLPDIALASIDVGLRVGKRVVAYAEADGAQHGWNGARVQFYGEGRVYGPGTWQPTPPYFYYPPDEPFAPLWKTWVLKTASEFRPIPPKFGSTRYLDDLKEVIEINAKLSPEQLRIAQHWVDGHGSVTPPGRWNRIAIEAVRKHKLSEKDTLRLFATMNIALADTFIAVWDTKYFFWTARPITVAKNAFGDELKPPILTPPFPSYVSGHAAFSGAASTVLLRFMPREARQFSEQAEEAANSRLLGGIHFRHDNEDGLALGRKIGQRVLKVLEP